MNKPWIKNGLLNGFKVTAIFSMIMIIWALIISISNNLGISPGWSMITFMVVGIFAMSLDSERRKYSSELAEVDDNSLE